MLGLIGHVLLRIQHDDPHARCGLTYSQQNDEGPDEGRMRMGRMALRIQNEGLTCVCLVLRGFPCAVGGACLFEARL